MSWDCQVWERIADDTDSNWRRDERLRAVPSVRLGPESFLHPSLDTEIISIASAKADLGDRGE